MRRIQVCALRLLLEYHDIFWRHLLDEHIPCLICAVQLGCPWTTFIHPCVWDKDNVRNPHPISAHRCVKATDDACSPCLMLVKAMYEGYGRWCHATFDVSWLMSLVFRWFGWTCPTLIDHFVQPKGSSSIVRLTSDDHCVQTKVMQNGISNVGILLCADRE